ncbi:hypothetical protein Btru_001785 [Bulinus truncatus]|nr:hypothetical protein Btru_001785 [Bulinus truncatus]
MATTVDADIPETGAVFTFGKSKFADNLPNKFWVKNDRVLQVACGDEHTALIAESGRVFMFGPNEWGQLGLGQDNKGVNKPSCVKSLKHEKSKYVACGRSHTLITTETGHIYSFGNHADGQLGYKTSTDQHIPKRIESLPPTKYKMLSAGSDSSVALTDDGKVFMWGNNEDGKLGLGEVEIVEEPTQLPMDRPAICVACGYYHTAVVTDDGKLFTMGESDGGKLGLAEDTSETNVPQLVTGISELVRWVSCGSTHTVVLTESGQCYVFGEGESGQLGLGTDILSVNKPTHLKLPFKVIKVYCGQAFTALISEKGQLYTFGDGRHGKLAHGDDQFSNQFKPYHCTRFSNFIVTKAACGGCHMIVTAKPKPRENGNISIDGEIDEMKSLEDKSLIEIINDGSPSLSRTLSAREKRRNEVTRSFSTLTDLLPALNRSSLSTTMPALRSSHHKVNGNVLNKTVATELANMKGNKIVMDNEEKSEVDLEKNSTKKDHTPTASPRRNLQSPQNLNQVEDGNDGDDEDGEGSLSDETGDKHHSEESNDETKDLLALSAELQKNIEDDSDNEKSASRSDPKSLTHINSNELHKKEKDIHQTANELTHNGPKLEEGKDKKDDQETAADHIDTSPSKKGPLPVPRKKAEQTKKKETVEESEETAEESEEEEEEEKKEDEIMEKEDHAKKDGKDKKKNNDKKDKEKEKPEKGKKDKKLEEKSKEDSKSKKGDKGKEKEVKGKEKEEKEKNITKEEKSTNDKKKKEADKFKQNKKKGKKENDEDEEEKELKEQNDNKNNKNKKKQAEEKDAKKKTKSKKGEGEEIEDEDKKPADEKDENENKKPPAKKWIESTFLFTHKK